MKNNKGVKIILISLLAVLVAGGVTAIVIAQANNSESQPAVTSVVSAPESVSEPSQDISKEETSEITIQDDSKEESITQQSSDSNSQQSNNESQSSQQSSNSGNNQQSSSQQSSQSSSNGNQSSSSSQQSSQQSSSGNNQSSSGSQSSGGNQQSSQPTQQSSQTTQQSSQPSQQSSQPSQQVSTPTVINVTGVSLNTSSKSVTEGDSFQLSATITPSNATDKSITWTSSNTSVATVSNGYVTTHQAGSATIYATSSNGKQAPCTVRVTAKTISVTGVSLNTSSKSVTEGDSFQLSATITPSNATDKSYTWASSNTNIATVDSNGYVTTKQAGNVTITATTKDGNKSASCTITVNAKQQEQSSTPAQTGRTWALKPENAVKDSKGNTVYQMKDILPYVNAERAKLGYAPLKWYSKEALLEKYVENVKNFSATEVAELKEYRPDWFDANGNFSITINDIEHEDSYYAFNDGPYTLDNYVETEWGGIIHGTEENDLHNVVNRCITIISSSTDRTPEEWVAGTKNSPGHWKRLTTSCPNGGLVYGVCTADGTWACVGMVMGS